MYLKTGAVARRSGHILNLVPLKPWRHTRSCRRHLGAGRSDELTLAGSSAVISEGPSSCCSFLISLFDITERTDRTIRHFQKLIILLSWLIIVNSQSILINLIKHRTCRS